MSPITHTGEGRKPTAAVLTLGCKVNQFESAAMTRILTDAGYVIVGRDEPADLTIINTCTVTHRADFEVRALVRRAHRTNPAGRTIVTGCLAQTRPEDVAGLPGVALVLGQDLKPEILKYLDSQDGGILIPPPGRIKSAISLGYPEFDRTRAFFRIQDGCSAVCAYCAVPRARGPSRSLPAGEVREGIRHYGQAGYEEIVLTGIHIGAWGGDLQPPMSLTELLEAEARAPSGPRLRISSIEPNEVTPGLLDLVRNSPRFCPHLHLPLQSGSDRILEAMRRPYPAAVFRDVVEQAVAGRPDFCIGVDVLVGFPGEDEAAFNETRALLESLPVSYLHVFPYSPRPGTLAAGFPDQVVPEIRKKRVAVLRNIGKKKKLAFYRQCLGQVRPVLIENTPDKKTGLARGLTDNYMTVLVSEPAPAGGRMAMVRLESLTSDGQVLASLAEHD